MECANIHEDERLGVTGRNKKFLKGRNSFVMELNSKCMNMWLITRE